MKIISNKFVDKLEPDIICSITFFFGNYAVYEIMSKYVVERGRPQMILWFMRIACWVPKATNAHTSCVILTAFPLQQWLHERASMLRCMYMACLVYSKFSRPMMTLQD